MAPKAKNINRATNIVALLEHKPGPGIYSRLERAVQQLPENVRVQELPGLLKRYKDGIPGWELKAVDFDSITAGRTTVPRDELLAAVRERSPVFTLKNVVLGGAKNPLMEGVSGLPFEAIDVELAPLGGTAYHGSPMWEGYGLGGPGYQERLLVQQEEPFPGRQWQGDRLRNHFPGDFGGNVASHLRTDRNADALRIVELQSDVQNQAHRAADPAAVNFPAAGFWQELQLKSALLDAARGGYRAIEVADPEDISRVVHFPAQKSEKYYGNMIPQLLERQGKKLGGYDSTSRPKADAIYDEADASSRSFADGINSIENQNRAAVLDGRVLELAGTDDIHIAEEILRSRPELISNSSLPDEAKTEISQYLDYADHRGTIWDNTGAEDFYSAMEALRSPTWRNEYGFNGMDAARIADFRRRVGLADAGNFDPSLVGEMGNAERALRELDKRSEDLYEKIMGEVAWEADQNNQSVFGRDLDRQLSRLAHTIQATADARATVRAMGGTPRGELARLSGPELYDKLVSLIGEEKAATLMPRIMGDIEQYGEMRKSMLGLQDLQDKLAKSQRQATPSGWRGEISDEMRRRIINEGIPAAIAIGAGTGLAAGGGEAEAAPFNRLPAVDGFRQARFGLQAPGPNETQNIRSLISASERQKVNRLATQIDEAYAANDFKRAEDLEAQREQLVEDLDNRINQATEDAEADFSDWEPNEYEGSTYEMTEQLAGIYGEFAREGSYRDPADLADTLRSVFPDTERANQIPEQELVEFAKQAFEEREALKAVQRQGEPGFAIREAKTWGRRVGVPLAVAGATAAGTADAASLTRPEDTIRQQGGWLANQMGQQLGTFDELMAAQPATKPSEVNRTTDGGFDFSMAISPAEWEAYYAQRAESGVEDPEHRQFKENVAQVLQQPLIRVGAARDTGLLADGDDYDRISPAQFVNEYIDRYYSRLSDDQRSQVMARVSDKLSGETRAPDDMADRIINGMMTAMTESAPKGSWAKSDPMPQEQLDSLRQQYGDWADSMLTPGSAENFETQRGLELLRTTQDGQFAPQYADSMSNVVSFAKGFVDPQARKDFGDLALKSGPVGRFTKANRDYFGSRPRGNEPPAFRNPDGSSRFVDTSTSNVRGLFRAGGDTSNWIGRYSWPLYQSFAELSRTPVGKAVTGGGIDSLWSQQGWSDWNHMAQQRNAFEREQPVNPGFSPEQFAAQKDAYEQDREKGEAWGSATYPNVQQAWDNVKGVLGYTSPTPKTWGTPLYNDYVTGFFQNTIGNIPSAAIMAGAVATGGMGGLAAGAIRPAGGNMVRTLINAGKGAGRGVASGAGSVAASQVKDLPFDFTADQAVGGAMAGFGNYMRYMLTPEEENALLPDVDPSQMSIEELNRRRSAAMQQREDEFQLNKDAWNRR